MQRIAVNASASGGSCGAASIPHSPENTTRLITRGLVSARMSRQSAGSAAGLVISKVGIGAPIKADPSEGKPVWRCSAKLCYGPRMKHPILAAALLAALSAPALSQTPVPSAAATAPVEGLVPVAIDTSAGRIVVALDQRHAPITTANFLRYVDNHRLDGETFYRAMHSGDGGLIQGGVRSDARK